MMHINLRRKGTGEKLWVYFSLLVMCGYSQMQNKRTVVLDAQKTKAILQSPQRRNNNVDTFQSLT